ncbi:MAG: hypothetical protein ACYC5Y_09910 [Symbiobacteriia bacterium]
MATITVSHDSFGDERVFEYLGAVNAGIITVGASGGNWNGKWSISAPRLRVNRRELSAYVPGGLTDEQWALFRQGVYELDTVTESGEGEFIVEGPDGD